MYDYESVSYGVRENPDKPVIVMLHEGLGSVSMWRDFPAKLHAATTLPVLVYSRRGYGNSDLAQLPRTVRFMHEEAQLLQLILKHHHIENPILYGHSDGGSIALIHAGSDVPAALHPRMLILEAPHVFVEELTVQSIAEARKEYEMRSLKPRLAKYHHDIDHTFIGWSDIWLDPAFRLWNIEEYLPRISVPILLIQGEDDAYGTLRQVESIEKNCQGTVRTLILPNCGHSCHRDAPDEVAQAAAEFIRSNFSSVIDN